MEPLYWLIAMAVFLIIEILTLGLTTIWFAGGALIAFFAALLNVPWFAQIIIFFIVSFVMLIFTRPVFEKKLIISRAKTNVNSLVGKEGKVIETVDNHNQKGAVLINGLQWTARSSDDNVIINEGERVTVEEITGVRAIVQPVTVQEP